MAFHRRMTALYFQVGGTPAVPARRSDIFPLCAGSRGTGRGDGVDENEVDGIPQGTFRFCRSLVEGIVCPPVVGEFNFEDIFDLRHAEGSHHLAEEAIGLKEQGAELSDAQGGKLAQAQEFPACCGGRG